MNDQKRATGKRGSKESQEALRLKATEIVSKGLSMRQAALMFGVSYSAVRQWCKRRKEEGEQGLLARKRGRKTLTHRRLSQKQEQVILLKVSENTPEQLKLPFVLWERRAVQEYIMERYGIQLPLRTVSLYLKRWGLTCQRPARRFYERDDRAAQEWREKTYPGVARRARQQGAEIQWADQSGVCNRSSSAARGFSPRGRTPELKEAAVKARTNFISSITNQGKMRFMIYDGKFNAEVFISFLQRSVKAAQGRKIIMIVDNYRVHKSVAVRQWLEERKHQLELEYLPAYCPELNPDEYLNCDVKANVHRQRMPRNKEELEANTRSILTKISRSKKRVKSYFKANHIAYAA